MMNLNEKSLAGFYVAMHREEAAGGRFCSQESREKFFPQGNWMTIPSPYDMLEEE